jgi:hypothetical protein
MDEHFRDKLLTEIHTDVAVIKERIQILADHEVRLRSLERFRFAFPGAAVLAVCVAAAGVVLQLT